MWEVDFSFRTSLLSILRIQDFDAEEVSSKKNGIRKKSSVNREEAMRTGSDVWMKSRGCHVWRPVSMKYPR